MKAMISLIILLISPLIVNASPPKPDIRCDIRAPAEFSPVRYFSFSIPDSYKTELESARCGDICDVSGTQIRKVTLINPDWSDSTYWWLYIGRWGNVLMIRRNDEYWVENAAAELDLLSLEEVIKYKELWRLWIPCQKTKY